MRKIIMMVMALLAICLPSEAQKFLDIYKNGNIFSSVKAADVDSMVVDEFNNRSVYFYHDGKAFHHINIAIIDSVKVYDLAKSPLVYLGIVGFNQELYEKPFGILDKNKAGDYKSFVSGLTRKDGTLLYYAVEHALDMLQNQSFPSQVGSVNLITFTDGLDQGSLMMNGNYTTDEQYLNAVSSRISDMKIKDLPLTAYSLGLRGSDVTDYQQFQSNLKKLASSPDKAFEVSNMSAVRECLQNISEQIISISTKQTISLKIPGQSNGTIIRFTFDGSSASNSTMYIEGTFNLADRSLRNVTYHGLRAENGETVQGKQDGIFVTFTFTGLQREDGNGLVPTYYIRQYYKSPSSSNWQENSEFTPANNTQTSVVHSGAVILLVLDCSNSLGSQFNDMKNYANDFIDRVANNAIVDIERPFHNTIGDGSLSNPWNPMEANNYVSSLAADTPSSDSYYIKGKIAKIANNGEFNSNYGNASFYISNDGKDENTFYVFRTLYLGNKKWQDGDTQIKVGDEVIIYGKLVNYRGNVPETVPNESYIYSLNGKTEDTGGGGGGEQTGVGSYGDPYSVAAAVAAGSGSGVYVKAYIVGYVSGQVLADGAHFTADGCDVKTNLLIADSPTETNVANCIPVQLPNGAVRTGLNLQNNPGNLGKQVLLYGNIEKYFGTTGLKSVTYAEIGGASIGTKP